MSAKDKVEKAFNKVMEDLPEGAKVAVILHHGDELVVRSGLGKEELGFFCVDFLKREGLARVIVTAGEDGTKHH